MLDRRDLARLFRVRTETIRNWERRGILPPPTMMGARPYWSPASIAALVRTKEG
jgi:DNA-binding transcriptional MerR regulator